jgi:hypothetical protein
MTLFIKELTENQAHLPVLEGWSRDWGKHTEGIWLIGRRVGVNVSILSR